MDLPRVWGATPQERALSLPCDVVAPAPAETWFRAVDVDAAPAVVYRWLCQLKVAPYSYDWIDNFGRRSPRSLTPGAAELRVGDRIMTIFELVDLEPGRHLTIRMVSRRALALFGEFALSYVVTGVADRSRLLAKLNVGRQGDPRIETVRREALAWGDLLMMRRQLLTLKELAEAQQASARS